MEDEKEGEAKEDTNQQEKGHRNRVAGHQREEKRHDSQDATAAGNRDTLEVVARGQRSRQGFAIAVARRGTWQHNAESKP